MTPTVTYALDGGIATVTMDDGRANLMTVPLMHGLLDALDRAERDGAVVVLSGRPGLFSAGYDRALFDAPIADIAATVKEGAELVHRLLRHPFPTVAACSGHAVAQGAFVLLACDVRLCTDADVRIGLNEVAIGLTIPQYGVELARDRLSPAWFDHAAVTGTLYPPRVAHDAGFVHRVVPVDDFDRVVEEEARRLRELDMAAHAATKARVRGRGIRAIRRGIDDEFAAATS